MSEALHALLLSAGIAFGLGVGYATYTQPDPYSQSDFPCQEDEVLGYSPQFGTERVGCIHIDDLKEEK